MKTKQSLFAISILLLFVLSLNNCTKKSDIIKYGQISGKVKSSSTGEPISGAGISLSPSNSSTTTGSDGAYSFEELEPRQYSIQVAKDGFQTNTTSVEVVAGENRLGDILLTPAQPILQVSTTLLDFGSDNSILPIEIRNIGASPLTWSVAGDKPWLSVNPASGTTAASAVNSVNITVNRSLLGRSIYTGTISITSNGGSASINVTVNIVNPVLYVTTTLLDFGSEQSILPFEIKNSGAGELIWSITSDKPWLIVNPASGNITSGTSAINATIDRSQIGKSTFVGTLVVNSNGGTATINVTVNVNGPIMNVTPSSLVFDATDSEKTLQISNIGIGNLTYSAQTTQSWITFMNSSGSTTTEIKLMPVIVNRQGLSPGDYSGTIVINSNANNITINVSLKVAAPAAPQLTNGTISNLTSTTADISGNITNLGSSAVTQHGHCWSTATNPTIDNNKTNLGGATTTGGFTSNITELSPGTNYYVRAYAINSVGISYSTQIVFTTDAGQQPGVSTTAVNSITSNSASSGGNVTFQGGTPVSARGVCWSTTQNPTILNNHTSDGSGMGSFTSDLTGLTAATTYYVRAYATNNAGTAYGNQVQFTTTAGLPPTVNTSSITEISAISASGGGNVSSEGGTTVSSRGVCWSTSPNPSISNSHTNDGTGTGVFNSSLTNLSPLTSYYVRAYATNLAGTSYGNQVQFTTVAGQSPTVSTTNITNTTNNSATSGGNVTEEGTTPVTARGVCWNTSSGPTISNNHTANGSGTGSFNSNLTGLEAITTYYVRAYATNSIGTAYGNEVSFTTLVAPPVVTTGLLAYYTFENQNANDWTGNFNGIAYNIEYSTSTLNGSNFAANFNGSNSYISILHAFYSGNMDFTFSIWIKSATSNFIFFSEFGGVYTSNYVGIDNNNKVKYAMNHLSPYVFTNPTSSLLDNSWHHFVYRRQGNTLVYFIDNVLMDSRNETGSMHENIKTNIGNSGYFNNDYFQGMFDNVRFFNRALTNQEIQTIYNAQQ